ncbi:MAG TPA: hypothetical protein VF773_03690 [Verrucomicrobiae bacterium]
MKLLAGALNADANGTSDMQLSGEAVTTKIGSRTAAAGTSRV